MAAGRGLAQQYLLQCLEQCLELGLGLCPLSATLSSNDDAIVQGIPPCERHKALPCMSARPPQTALIQTRMTTHMPAMRSSSMTSVKHPPPPPLASPFPVP